MRLFSAFCSTLAALFSCDDAVVLFRYRPLFILASSGFSVVVGIAHWRPNLRAPSRRSSEHNVWIRRVEISHSYEASCIVMYSICRSPHEKCQSKKPPLFYSFERTMSMISGNFTSFASEWLLRPWKRIRAGTFLSLYPKNGIRSSLLFEASRSLLCRVQCFGRFS